MTCAYSLNFTLCYTLNKFTPAHGPLKYLIWQLFNPSLRRDEVIVTCRKRGRGGKKTRLNYTLKCELKWFKRCQALICFRTSSNKPRLRRMTFLMYLRVYLRALALQNWSPWWFACAGVPGDPEAGGGFQTITCTNGVHRSAHSHTCAVSHSAVPYMADDILQVLLKPMPKLLTLALRG